jgi:basic membrane lipoprotein Med (substrate-binding protein (PBP1-ABC) superfamily)
MKNNIGALTKSSAVLIALLVLFAVAAAVGWTRPPETRTIKEVSTTTVTIGGVQTITVTKTEAGGTLKKELVVRAVFQTPVSEPWDGAIHTAILAVAEEFKAKGIKVDYQFVDRKIDPKEYELALRDAAKVADVVFLDAFLKEDIARRVAKEFPKVAFAAGSEFLPTPPNFAVFDNWLHQPAFLAGLIAGKITKTNKVGVVAAMEINEVNRIVNAFIAGAKTANPNVKAKVMYLLGNIPPGESPWYHPATAKRLAKTMIDLGADVIFAERVGAEEAAVEALAGGKNVWIIGNMADQYERARDVTITSLIWDMRPTVRIVFERVLSGTFVADNLGTYSWMSFGGSYLADFHHFGKPSPPLTQDILNLVKEWEVKINTGLTWVPIIESPPISDY